MREYKNKVKIGRKEYGIRTTDLDKYEVIDAIEQYCEEHNGMYERVYDVHLRDNGTAVITYRSDPTISEMKQPKYNWLMKYTKTENRSKSER